LIAKTVSIDCWAGKPNILVVTPKNIEREYENTAVGSTMGKGCAQKSEQLGEEYKKIAEMMGVYYFDANTVVKDYNKIDYMHRDEEGHKALAAALAQLIPTIV